MQKNIYSITITKSGILVYNNTGLLKGLSIEKIPINWEPVEDGNYTLTATGIGVDFSIEIPSIIAVYSSKSIPISPVPELSTILLTSAGLIGVLGLARMKRKE